MYLFIDTETTGLPKNYNASHKDGKNWPRIIQLAFAVHDEGGQEIDNFSALIKPDGWTVPTEKFWIENGYSQAESEARGLPIKYCIEELILKINQYPYLIAHNMSFDKMIIAAEMYRLGLESCKRPKLICTKEASTAYCKIAGPYGFKWPKLEELYKHLFGKSFEGAHDALNDVRACADCFFELKSRGVIKL